MSADSSQKVWIPVCCGRVMRFNRFLKADGEAFGSMVCTICNKNIVLEQEAAPAEGAYGEGTRMKTRRRDQKYRGLPENWTEITQ